MDEPTDPLTRQLALSALTTEQFNLQTARMGTIAEANGRSALYLGTLSSASSRWPCCRPCSCWGVFSYLRLVQTSIEDMVYAVGSFRIRQYFLGLDPAAVPFFPPTDPQGMTKLERIGVVASGPLQLLLTAASMVGCINAIVGGITVALVVHSLLEASVALAAITGTLVGLGLAALCFAYQVRRFGRAAAVAPQLYAGQSPGMPGWTERSGEREG